jgi:hypothetical protein
MVIHNNEATFYSTVVAILRRGYVVDLPVCMVLESPGTRRIREGWAWRRNIKGDAGLERWP